MVSYANAGMLAAKDAFITFCMIRDVFVDNAVRPGICVDQLCDLVVL
jgi:hypothetical protein